MAKHAVDEELRLLSTALLGGSDSADAAESLFVIYAPMINNLARHFSWDADSLEEIAQEGKLAFVEALPLFEPSRKLRLSTFIHQRAKSRMMHWRRSQQRALSLLNPHASYRLRSLDEVMPLSDDDGATLHEVLTESHTTPPEGADFGIVAGILRKAIKGLASRQADAIRLMFWDNLSAAQVADFLGVSRPRATVLLQTGLMNLRCDLAFMI